jgi:hypothetical protein
MPDEGAFDLMRATLREWGLESLLPDVREMLEDGRAPEQISVLLQDTEAYNRRFAGNELRRQKGLAVLSPRDYLQTELAYRQIMESAGLPSGFYDSPEDFADWIGNDVAPLEIKTRVDEALDVAFQLDEPTAQAFQDFYGISRDGLAAYFLDRERGLQELERTARAGLIGGAARAQGLSVGRGRAEELAGSTTVARDDYRRALGQVAGLTEDAGRLSGLYGGVDYGQDQAEQEVFFADEEARRRRRKLIGLEEGEFSEGSGASPAALARSPGQV